MPLSAVVRAGGSAETHRGRRRTERRENRPAACDMQRFTPATARGSARRVLARAGLVTTPVDVSAWPAANDLRRGARNDRMSSASAALDEKRVAAPPPPPPGERIEWA